MSSLNMHDSTDDPALDIAAILAAQQDQLDDLTATVAQLAAQVARLVEESRR